MSDTFHAIERAKELLATVAYANIATANNLAEPWNTPLYAPRDEALNFYWSSWVGAVHSNNIRSNPPVFMTLYDSTRARGTNNLRCLYLLATASEVLGDAELSFALSLLYPGEAVPIHTFHGDSVKRIYKAVPSRVWLNDRSEREVDPSTVKMRLELNLPDLMNWNRP
ncbi:MAG: hypothetical protein U0136_14020 [Bdellovibrionota bacterium]